MSEEIHITSKSVKFGEKIFYLQHVSTTNIVELSRRLSFDLNFFFGSVVAFVASLCFPFYVLSSKFGFSREMVVANLIFFSLSGIFVFLGIKERQAKIRYALEMVYSGSNTQLFINTDRQFIREVQSKIDEAIDERLKVGTYIFDNSLNSVKVEGDVIGSSLSGRDTNVGNLSIGLADLDASQDLLNAVKDIVTRSDNYVLEAIHSHFRKEAQKESPNTSKLQKLWPEMVAIATDLAKLTRAFQKVFC